MQLLLLAPGGHLKRKSLTVNLWAVRLSPIISKGERTQFQITTMGSHQCCNGEVIVAPQDKTELPLRISTLKIEMSQELGLDLNSFFLTLHIGDVAHGWSWNTAGVDGFV